MSRDNYAFDKDGRFLVNTNKPAIKNSFGVSTNEGLLIAPDDAFYLFKYSLLAEKFPPLNQFSTGLQWSFDMIRYSTIEKLRQSNFIVSENGGGYIDVYYPGLRTKALLESISPILVQYIAPDESFPLDHSNRDCETKLIAVSDHQENQVFFKVETRDFISFAP